MSKKSPFYSSWPVFTGPYSMTVSSLFPHYSTKLDFCFCWCFVVCFAVYQMKMEVDRLLLHYLKPVISDRWQTEEKKQNNHKITYISHLKKKDSVVWSCLRLLVQHMGQHIKWYSCDDDNELSRKNWNYIWFILYKKVEVCEIHFSMFSNYIDIVWHVKG